MAYWQWFVMGWPGLPRLWREGAFDALAVAGLFAVLVNAAIYVEWVVPHRVVWQVRWLLWSVVVVYWVVAQRWQWRCQRRGFDGGDSAYEGRLRQAQQAYLQGRWVEAENHLRQMLAEVAEDREARLLLASLLRRTGRRREALRELGRLLATPGRDKWQWEIAQERSLLERAPPPTMEHQEDSDGALAVRQPLSDGAMAGRQAA